jgi:hypothetical protein
MSKILLLGALGLVVLVVGGAYGYLIYVTIPNRTGVALDAPATMTPAPEVANTSWLVEQSRSALHKAT